jgi:hypothetical protein
MDVLKKHTPKIAAKFASETSIDFHRTTRRYVKEGTILHTNRWENLKCNLIIS